MRKPAVGRCDNKGAVDRTADQLSVFGYIEQSIFFLNPIFMPLAISCGCTAQLVMMDLVLNLKDRLSHGTAHLMFCEGGTIISIQLSLIPTLFRQLV